MILDARKDDCEHHRNERKERGRSRQLGKRVKGPRQRRDERDDRHDGRKANRAHRVVRHGVQVLGTRQDMQGLDEGIVQEEHRRRRVPDPFPVVKEHLAQVADVAHFGVPEAEFPDDERGVEDQGGHEDSEDLAWHQCQHRVRVREAHDGQANVLAEE